MSQGGCVLEVTWCVGGSEGSLGVLPRRVESDLIRCAGVKGQPVVPDRVRFWVDGSRVVDSRRGSAGMLATGNAADRG